jgi:RNA polymerase sigma-70 factor (sigma-E family)
MRAEHEAEYVSYLRARLARWHRAAYLLCGDTHLAEDLVQSTALALYRHWRRAHRAGNLDAYAHRVLVNQFLGERRRPWSRVLLSYRPLERPAPAVPSVEERDAVNLALAHLGPSQRAVLVLRFFCDLTVEQTATVLGCSVGNVKSQTARGLVTLRLLLTGPPDPARTDTGKGVSRG